MAGSVAYATAGFVTGDGIVACTGWPDARRLRGFDGEVGTG